MKLLILFLCIYSTHAIISPRTLCQNNPVACVEQDFYIDNSTDKCHTDDLKINNVTIWAKKQCDSFMPHILLEWVNCKPVYDYVPKVYENINCTNVATNVQHSCIKWKKMEYCEINVTIWIVMAVVVVFFLGILLYSCDVCPGPKEFVINTDGSTYVKKRYKPRKKRVL